MKEINNFFKGKKILVTGGSGSIGSEIVKQLLLCKPEVVRVFSNNEAEQFWLDQKLGTHNELRYLIGDVRDRYRLKRAMEGTDIVFHAAALKHVHLCEYNPFEAVQTNVLGTQYLIESALDAGVKYAICISTDKAVNPVNTLGATKLLAEKLFVAASQWTKSLKLGCVRFGNVLYSEGSVVPLIINQIKQGGPVTITDKNMTRFILTMEDAISLVLQATTLIDGGEVYILKMKALKIIDLIDVLIKTYAPKFGLDYSKITVKTIGIRPGEKIHEELICSDELPRTEDKVNFLKVYPSYLIPRLKFKPQKINPAIYNSFKTKKLSKSEIQKLLEITTYKGESIR